MDSSEGETPEMVFRDLLEEWEDLWRQVDGDVVEQREFWLRRWAEAEARAVERGRILDERLRP